MSQEIEKQAKALSVMHPMNTYPTVVGAIFFMYSIAEFSIASVVAGGAFITLGLGSFIANYFVRTNHFMELALKTDHDDRQEALHTRVTAIGDSLRKFHQTDAQTQLKQLIKKVNTFTDILNNRFDGQGLAYSRFLGISDTIYSNSLKAYEEMILLLKQADGIDAERCRSQIAAMRNDESKSSQVRTLTTRLKLKTEIAHQVESMLLSNEEAMTKLDLTMTSFSDQSTESELEWAMKELQNLSTALKPKQNGDIL